MYYTLIGGDILELLLVGQLVFKFEIISCKCNTKYKDYDIGYKCLRCGNIIKTHINNKKVCVLRCNACNNRSYIIPFIDYNTNEINGYRIVDNNTYNKIRVQYNKLENRGDWIEYIRDYLIKIDNK